MGDLRVKKARVRTTSLPLPQDLSVDILTWRPVPPTSRPPPGDSSHLPMMHCGKMIFDPTSGYPGWMWFNRAAVSFITGFEWKRRSLATRGNTVCRLTPFRSLSLESSLGASKAALFSLSPIIISQPSSVILIPPHYPAVMEDHLQ